MLIAPKLKKKLCQVMVYTFTFDMIMRRRMYALAHVNAHNYPTFTSYPIHHHQGELHQSSFNGHQ